MKRIVFQSILVLLLLIAFSNKTVSADTLSTSLFSVDDGYTVSLLHMNGVDGTTTFSDESGKTWTAYGDAQLDTAQSKFGGTSGFFDGSGDYIDTPDDADFNVGSGDFTVDFWFRKNINGTYQPAFGQSNGSQSHSSLSVYGYFGLYNNKLEFGGYATSQTNSRLIYIDSDTTVTDTNWHHFAGVRSGNTLYLFLDGLNVGTADVEGYTFINSSYKMAIGRLGEYGGDYANGWIDEFRFSKGIARWTDNFTPPTTEYPFTTTTPTYPTTGLDDAYTVSLLHANGSDRSIVFMDESGKVWNPRGNIQIDTAQSKFGGASGLFDGNGDYIDTPDHADFNVGSGDFTVDFWFRKNGNGTNQAAFGQTDPWVTGTSLSIYGYISTTDNKIHFGGNMGSTRISLNSSGTVTDTNWHHYAAVRSGNTLYLFLDGINQGTADVTGFTFNNSSSKIAIGRVGEYPYDYANGWIDEFRFSKGIARWTSNFTLPTAEYIPAMSPTATPTNTPTLTPTATLTFTPTATFTPTSTPTNTSTITPINTATFTPTNTFVPGTPHANGTGTCWASGASWPTYDVLYKIDSSIPADWHDSIHEAAFAWNEVAPSGFDFLESPIGGYVIDKGPLEQGFVALTLLYAQDSTLTGMSTRFNEAKSWDPSHPPSSTSHSVRNLMTHEFGHWLKLEDISTSGCTDATMWHSVPTEGAGETKKESLETPDINGMNYQYP